MASTPLPSPRSLRGAAQAAASRGEPLVVMTTLEGCPYCDIVRNSHLNPMLKAGEVVAVQVDVRDRRTPMQGFAGEMSTPYDQVKAWKARVAPTLLFLDDQGREVAERLEGISSADFYGAYLDDRLAQARAVIRQRR